MDRFISYCRVSTAKQEASGLGLEAQQQAVRDHLNGGNWTLLEEFIEVESGKRDDRPELAKALTMAKLTGATLIVARMDRLSRSVAFLASLMDSGVKFLAVDIPEANSLTVHIMAAVAQDERERISARTKAALKAAKARGTKLGNPQLQAGTAETAAKAREHHQQQAQQRAEDLRPILEHIQQSGHGSLRAIAGELNRRGILTARGKCWHANSVRSLLQRL